MPKKTRKHQNIMCSTATYLTCTTYCILQISHLVGIKIGILAFPGVCVKNPSFFGYDFLSFFSPFVQGSCSTNLYSF